ncbi:hypothetical protein Plec18170_009765 [Paecilomyces lecythidis]
MKQSRVDRYEMAISEQRAAKYRGTVRVRLETLEFGTEGSRQLDAKNVERLQRVFRKEGCYRLEPENRIPAAIDQGSLEEAMRLSDTTFDDLLEIPQTSPPLLKFPAGFRLRCLEGQSRVKAAAETLRPEERWWGVDLYLEDMSSELIRFLVDHFPNATNVSDGEIYLKIRRHMEASRGSHDAGHQFAEKSWWARLSNNKQDNLMRLFKNKRKDYREAFDALSVIPGIWAGFRISMLKDLFGLQCREQVIHYIEVIGMVFRNILGGRLEWMELTDRRTVELLQLRVPGKCSGDLRILRQHFLKGDLFPAIKTEEHRQEIWNNLLTVDTLIPSLYTLFEDIKYLKPCATIVKRLLGAKPKWSVQQTLEECYSGEQQNDEVLVQQTENSFCYYHGGVEERVTLGSLQLWLFAARNFTLMIKEPPRKDDGRPTPNCETPDTSVWRAFATLASHLGFESDSILELRNNDPDREIARQALLGARKPHTFKYDDAVLESFQDQIVAMFAAAEEITNERGPSTFYVDGAGEDVHRRCGRVFERAYENDRQVLFLDALSNPDEGGGEGITSLFVRVSVLKAFFGRPVFNTAPANVVREPFGFSALAGDSPHSDRMLWQTDRSSRPLHDSRKQIEDLERQVEALRSDDERKTRQITRLESELFNARSNGDEVAQLREQNESLQRTVSSLQGAALEKNRLEQWISQLQDSLERAKQDQREMNELRSQNTARETELGVLQESTSRARAELEKYRVAESRRSSSRERELENEVDVLNRKLESLFQDNGQAQDRIKELRKKVKISEGTIIGLERKISSLKGRLQMTKSQNQASPDSPVDGQDTFRSINDKYKTLFVAHEMAKQRLQELEQEKSDAQTEAAKVDDLKQQIFLLESNLAEYRDRIASDDQHQKDIERLRDEKSDALGEEIRGLQEELVLKHEELHKLRSDLAQLQERDSATSDDYVRVQKELQDTKGAYDSLEEEIARLRIEASKLVAEKDEALSGREEVLREIPVLQAKIIELENARPEDSTAAGEMITTDTHDDRDRQLARIKELQDLNVKLAAQLNSAEHMIADEQMLFHTTIQEIQKQNEASRHNSEWITFKSHQTTTGGGREESSYKAQLTPSGLERLATKFVRKRRPLYLHTVEGKGLSPKNAFKTIKDNGTFTIHLVPEGETLRGRRDELPSAPETQSKPGYPPDSAAVSTNGPSALEEQGAEREERPRKKR